MSRATIHAHEQDNSSEGETVHTPTNRAISFVLTHDRQHEHVEIMRIECVLAREHLIEETAE
jgi:hypothetical protein